MCDSYFVITARKIDSINNANELWGEQEARSEKGAARERGESSDVLKPREGGTTTMGK
jgi:hypothetical protein